MNEVIHDLTILYLSKQNLSDLTPEQLYEKYKNVYSELKEYRKGQNAEGVTILK